MVDWLVADAYRAALERTSSSIRNGVIPESALVSIQEIVENDGLPRSAAWALVRQLEAEGLVRSRRGGFLICGERSVAV